MEWLTTNEMKGAFAAFDERLETIDELIKLGYVRLHARRACVLAGAPAPRSAFRELLDEAAPIRATVFETLARRIRSHEPDAAH